MAVSNSARPGAGAHRNALLAVTAVAAALLLIGVALVGPRWLGSSAPSGTAGRPSAKGSIASAVPGQSGPSSSGGPSSILNPDGWPISISSGDVGEVVVGPDGTVYAAGLVPVDGKGHGRVGWLALPDGSYLVPSAFGSDGSLFGEVDGKLWAFGPDGKPRSGWPIDVSASSWAVSPAASVYLMEWPTEGTTKVSILDAHAAPVASWSIPKVLDYSCDYLIQPDGTFWLTYPVEDLSWWGACEIHAYKPNGQELSPGPKPQRWTGMAMGPDGAVVAWYYGFTSQSQDRPDQTRIAVLGVDGKPAVGWPITLQGAASPPAFGSDGSIYLTVLGASGSRVEAFDAAGKAKPGWPVALTGDPLTLAAPETEPLRPESPMVGDGVVYVAGQTKIEAFDTAGKVRTGWPYVLPVAWDDSRCSGTPSTPVWNMGPVLSTTGTGQSRMYLGLEGQVVALTPDGAVAPGWPYRADTDGFVCWHSLDRAPDGGLIATAAYQKGDTPEFRIYRWTPEGAFPK